jgi:hypothetical protein
MGPGTRWPGRRPVGATRARVQRQKHFVEAVHAVDRITRDLGTRFPLFHAMKAHSRNPGPLDIGFIPCRHPRVHRKEAVYSWS